KRRLEAALQMKRALAKGLAQAIERDRFIEMLLDVAADLFREVRLRTSARRSRPAAQASAKASLLRLLRMREEGRVLAARPPRRTRRPAIDARARHGEDELSVIVRVAGHDRVPTT